jgi:hypothetical protein
MPCETVGPASWFPLAPVALLLLVLGGCVVALVVTARPGRNERLGALLVFGAVVTFGAALLADHSARTSVEVETSASMPDPWRITCESAFQAPPSDAAADPAIEQQFHDACADAMASDRTRVLGLLALSSGLLVAGAWMLVPRGDRRREPPSRDPVAEGAAVAG